MHRRKTRREVPDRPPYIVITMPLNHDHHFRTPSPITSRRLASLQQVDSIAAAGAIIGLAWYHEDFDLDAAPGSSDRDSELEFGAAVCDELHEDGYPLELLILMAAAIWRAIDDASTVSGAIQERIDFFTRKRGGTTSPSSAANADTSEAQEPSTA